MGFAPVFLDAALSDLFYEGYCNGALWPMFHSMTTYSKTEDNEYKAYVTANELFADAVCAVYKPGDIVWIQDYHLLLLPQELRRRLGYSPAIGFFLHIPFPHADVFRLLPHHSTLLESVMQADFVGFHTMDYVTNFATCLTRVCGVTPVAGRAVVPNDSGGHLVQFGALPLGIDFDRYHTGTKEEKVQALAAHTRRHLGVDKIVFSVSRLDYTKGVPHCLNAMRTFFQTNPEWVGRLTLILVVVPSRTRVDKYAELKKEIDRLVGEINGQLGTLLWDPIIYLYRSLDFNELLALYACADVGLIVPLRDGMNLCAKEYVAAHADGEGVLVLGNLAGAAHEMLEAVIVNPNSAESIVKGLKEALEMPGTDQAARNRDMAKRLETNDVHWWTSAFLHKLEETMILQQQMSVNHLDSEHREELVRAFRSARSRLLVLDYDGTLVPFSDLPSGAVPDNDIIELLGALAALPMTRVLILSGRDRNTLAEWLGKVPKLRMAAEHGCWTWTGTEWAIEESVMANTSTWKSVARTLMQEAVNLLAGSIVEEKEFSMVFHYRACESETSTLDRSKITKAVLELRAALQTALANLPVHLVDAKEALEVKAFGASKGAYYLRFLHKLEDDPDFVLAVGDDNTDEDVFEACEGQEVAHTVRVGFFPSKAAHHLYDYREVRKLLRRFLV
eukprot:TRINITY_DN1184_c0_g2_i1.p1 TRINITY_DN1184_c0_g2~~TRINITY_DN1184_c0_g2_i1.p1  ORF type:complete len:774 (-),score=191.85 TRINITY_DN1184_c0_g2_i1:74-2098(-)